jgi:hypothetical protein
MKLAGCRKEIFVLPSQQFYKGIVAALRRQLNQTLLHSACVVFHHHTTLKEMSYGE